MAKKVKTSAAMEQKTPANTNNAPGSKPHANINVSPIIAKVIANTKKA